MRTLILCAVALLSFGPGVAWAQTSTEKPEVALIGDKGHVPTPPATPRHAASSTLHGVTVADPYRWLEHGTAPEVREWIKAQNSYTDAVISGMPLGTTLNKRVRELAITSTTRSSPHLVHDTLFYLRQTPPQAQPMLVAQAWPKGTPKTLVDPNADDGRTAITAFWPSPDGRYLAWGTAEGGSELTTIHVLDVKTGKKLDGTLPRAGGGTTPQGLAWDADGKGFTYVRFPTPAADSTVKQFHAALAHHRLGDSASADRVVFGKDYSDIAEYRLLASPDGKILAVLANQGDGGPADVFLRSNGQWHKVLDAKANVRGAAWLGSRLAVTSFADAPRGKLLAIGADGAVKPLLAQRYGAVQRVAPIKAGFLVVRSWGADWWVEQYDGKSQFVRRLPLPETGIGVGGIASSADSNHALISYSGWTLPSRWAVYDANADSLRTVFTVKAVGDYSRIRAHQLLAVSLDGSRIPVTVLADERVHPNGRNPTVLYGYGGFDVPMAPRFLGDKLAWLERGGVYAVANIRGGNEFGQRWHAQGQKLKKQNVFDDFHTAAMALTQSGWTDARHLGIMGGSNGGLLMGSQIAQHPLDYRAVVSMVGIYDMLRHQTEFANGKYNVPEYGDVHDADQFKATLAYSPLQNITSCTRFPAVLMTTGVNDPRVAPWQSRKFAATLQSACRTGMPILLLTRMHAGHGIGAPFSQRVGDAAITLTFFAQELGLPSQTLSKPSKDKPVSTKP